MFRFATFIAFATLPAVSFEEKDGQKVVSSVEVTGR